VYLSENKNVNGLYINKSYLLKKYKGCDKISEMDFKLSKVRKDIPKLKDIVLNNDFYTLHTDATDGLTRLGSGNFGIVHGYGSAAVKREIDTISENRSYNWKGETVAAKDMSPKFAEMYEKAIALGDKGIQEGLHFAPYLDYAIKEVDNHRLRYAFMPRINGETLKSKNGLFRLVSVGAEGLKTFFEDHTTLHRIGLAFDDSDTTADNCIITDNNLNMVDIGIASVIPIIDDTEMQRLNLYGAATVLNHWHDFLVQTNINTTELAKLRREAFKELAGNTETALSKVKNSSQALGKVKVMQKSDFSKRIMI